MSKKASNKNKATTKGEGYTNLLLITVVEAMALLIGQLLIYNGFSVANITGAMWNYIIPTIFIVAVVVAVISVILALKGNNTKLWAVVSFAIYAALLMSLIRYIPNQYSESLGRYITNSLRGQKIGAVTSVIYIVVKFVYYFVAANKADKRK